MNSIRITDLFVYPIKSMGGIPLREAQLTGKGLRHDRHWMVVRENGHFVTQRDIPRMALVRTRLAEEGVELSLDGHGAITVPFEHRSGERIETAVWRVKCRGTDQGDDISDWLTRALDSEERLRLVRMAPEFRRPQNKPDIMGKDTTVDFADAAPLLVANEASLGELNSVLESKSLPAVPMDRFRPNIVIRGLEPFAEHELGCLSSSNFQLRFRAPCERCVVTTIDQETAVRDPAGQPFKALQSINPVPGKPQAPAFGQYATISRGETRLIKVGDNFEPIAVSSF